MQINDYPLCPEPPSKLPGSGSADIGEKIDRVAYKSVVVFFGIQLSRRDTCSKADEVQRGCDDATAVLFTVTSEKIGLSESPAAPTERAACWWPARTVLSTPVGLSFIERRNPFRKLINIVSTFRPRHQRQIRRRFSVPACRVRSQAWRSWMVSKVFSALNIRLSTSMFLGQVQVACRSSCSARTVR